MKMSNSSMKAASFKKWKCEKEKQVEMRKTNKQKKEGKKPKKTQTHCTIVITL